MFCIHLVNITLMFFLCVFGVSLVASLQGLRFPGGGQNILSEAEDPYKLNLNDLLRAKKLTGIAKDGNCLFRCVAQHVYGDVMKHERVRAEVVEELKQNKDKWFDNPLVYDEASVRKTTGLSSYEAYYTHLASIGSYGDIGVLTVCEHLYDQFGFKIFTEMNQPKGYIALHSNSWFLFDSIENGPWESGTTDVVNLFYHQNHYDLLGSLVAADFIHWKRPIRSVMKVDVTEELLYKRVKGAKWLSDDIILMHLHLLAQRYGPTDFLTVSSQAFKHQDGEVALNDIAKIERFITKEVLNSAKSVFFPANLNNNHWVLFVYVVASRKLYYFDSLPSEDRVYHQYANVIAGFFRDHHKIDGISCEAYECPEQANAFDCGVHVLQTAGLIMGEYTEFEALRLPIRLVDNGQYRHVIEKSLREGQFNIVKANVQVTIKRNADGKLSFTKSSPSYHEDHTHVDVVEHSEEEVKTKNWLIRKGFTQIGEDVRSFVRNSQFNSVKAHIAAEETPRKRIKRTEDELQAAALSESEKRKLEINHVCRCENK